uniref:Putative glycosylphosphatidylinositol (GPI) anchor n=1 Tax=Trypanosoma congolense (strain IL3000) TaxID=1068625 RepID=G0UL23_TRYCI|nr:putative glycosylphosphatidylinositol (GPI) anchor [Trypanosoma congolense IL3000]
MGLSAGRLIILLALLPQVLLLLLLQGPVGVQGLRPTVPRTDKKYILHVQPLVEGLDDEGKESTLVSLTATTSLWLPKGSADDREEHLSFNEDMDPFWVHVLRRRGFDLVEWSGCGGSWRPEWGATLYNKDFNVDKSTADLIHDLSHHVVCHQSTLSACGWVKSESSNSGDGVSSFNDAAARHHHQWLAQFVSSLLSSPLTWWEDTPRFIRPIGALHSVRAEKFNLSSKTDRPLLNGDTRWCSYHHAQHDTLCTQHVTAMLNGGRSGKDVEEHIPQGIFRAALLSVEDFFSSVFHHFRFEVVQTPVTSQGNSSEETEVKLVMRMAFVEQNKKFGALAAHWERLFPAYADRLTLIVGPKLNSRLSSALQLVVKAQQGKTTVDDKGTERKGPNGQLTGDVAATPVAHHFISAVGYDRGTYKLVVNPSPILPTADRKSNRAYSAQPHMLKPGDTLETLLFFPLHIIRPSLHEMRSGVGALSRLENAIVDTSANVLVVLVHTTVTEEFLKSREGPTGEVSGGSGLVVCEFPFRFGWAANKDMPPDANSNRILPQPIIRVGRRTASASGGSATGNGQNPNKQRCETSHCFATVSKRIDHQDSLERLMEGLRRQPTTEPCACYFWLRCSNVAGTTVPVPDPAMVFNVVTLGLIFSAVVAGGVTRATRRLFEAGNIEREDDKPLVVQIILKIYKVLRRGRL